MQDNIQDWNTERLIKANRRAQAREFTMYAIYYFSGAVAATILTLLVMSSAHAANVDVPHYSLEGQKQDKEFLVDKKYHPSPGEVRAQARVKVIIVDTGYNGDDAVYKLKLCKTGHFDFFDGTQTIGYTHRHGSEVASIIAYNLRNVDYCAVIYQVFDGTSHVSIGNFVNAALMAATESPTAVNMSLSGPMSSAIEERGLQILSARGAKIFVAAGNDHRDLNEACLAYPACYRVPGLVTVGAMSDDFEQKAFYSNYGAKVTEWYPGSYDQNGEERGTSFAAPRALSDYILSLVSIHR